MRPHVLAIPIHDSEGVVTGGFWGCTLFQWLHVQLLFIPEPLRGKGVGSALMTAAEIEARKRGCIGAHVTSFSFQAAPFYEKLGYAPFGQLDNYPPGHNLLYLRKRFDAPAATAETISLADARKQQALKRARALAVSGQDDAAKQAYVDVLCIDATDFAALNELGALAYASGYRAAARTAYGQAVQFTPAIRLAASISAICCLRTARLPPRGPFEAALVCQSRFSRSPSGMARVLDEPEDDAAEQHRKKGYAGHAIVTRPYVAQ